MDNNNFYACDLNSLTCEELRDRLRSLQEAINKNRCHARIQALERDLRTQAAPVSSRFSGYLPFGRPIPVNVPYEKPPSVVSNGSSVKSSVCILCKRPLTVFDQNVPDLPRFDGRVPLILTPPDSRQSDHSPLVSANQQKSLRSVHFKERREDFRPFE